MSEDFQGMGFDDEIYEADPSKLKYADDVEINNSNNSREHINISSILVTIIIVLANLVAGIMCVVARSNHFDTGGLNYEYMHNNKEYIRLLTYMFLHANFVHFANNMIALIIFGIRLEPKIGSLKMAIIYFGSGIIGGIVSVNMSHLVEPNTISYAAGASAAIFGVMCAYLFERIKGRREAKRRDMFIAIGIIVAYAVISNGANVDIWGHIGGGIAGGILGFLLTIKKSRFFEVAWFCKIIAVLFTICFSVIGVLRAGIGEENRQLVDERIDFLKNQEIYVDYDYTFGQCFEENCSDEKWEIFSADGGLTVIEFTGYSNYKKANSKIICQFTYQEDKDCWIPNYLEIDGIAQNSDGYDELLDTWSKKYFEGK